MAALPCRPVTGRIVWRPAPDNGAARPVPPPPKARAPPRRPAPRSRRRPAPATAPLQPRQTPGVADPTVPAPSWASSTSFDGAQYADLPMAHRPIQARSGCPRPRSADRAPPAPRPIARSPAGRSARWGIGCAACGDGRSGRPTHRIKRRRPPPPAGRGARAGPAARRPRPKGRRCAAARRRADGKRRIRPAASPAHIARKILHPPSTKGPRSKLADPHDAARRQRVAPGCVGDARGQAFPAG